MMAVSSIFVIFMLKTILINRSQNVFSKNLISLNFRQKYTGKRPEKIVFLAKVILKEAHKSLAVFLLLYFLIFLWIKLFSGKFFINRRKKIFKKLRGRSVEIGESTGQWL